MYIFLAGYTLEQCPNDKGPQSTMATQAMVIFIAQDVPQDFFCKQAR